jgi:hypothetical protein
VEKYIAECPLWALASTFLIEAYLSHFTQLRTVDSAVIDLMRHLIQYGASKGHSFSISIRFQRLGFMVDWNIYNALIDDLLVCFERHSKRDEMHDIAATPIGSATVGRLFHVLNREYHEGDEWFIGNISWRDSRLDFTGLEIRTC